MGNSMIYETLLSTHADLVVNEALRKFEEQRLYEEIDQALKEGDEKKFMELTEQWIRLKKERERRKKPIEIQ